MLYGLYNLSGVNREFTISAFFSAAFTFIGVAEFTIEILRVFAVFTISPLLYSIVAIVRTVLLGALTAYMLLGMQSVSREVGLTSLSNISKRLYILTLPVYSVNLLLEILGLFSLKEVLTLAILSVTSLVLTLTLTVLILIRIYDCYAKICMPEDKSAEEKPKESRFGFVNSFRRHEEKKQQEYAEYRLDKFKKKIEKKKSRDKK